MNQYKKAKLTNKNIGTEEPMPSQCSYCKRWGTYNEGSDSPEKDIDQKKTEELNPEEVSAVRKAFEQQYVSHGICDQCYKILEETGYTLDPKTIKEISLGMA